MMTVRIFQPLKSAMQSGKGRLKGWTLSFEPLDPALPEPLMGWTSSRDMRHELRLVFPTLLKAIEYARTRGFHYTVHTSSKITLHPKNYGTNFTCARVRGAVMRRDKNYEDRF